MVNIREVKNYIVENGIEKVDESNISHILDLDNDYSIEYALPIKMNDPDYITIRKRGFTQEFKGDDMDYLDAQLKKWNNIYELISYYETEVIMKEFNRKSKLEEVEKFMSRGE